MPCEGAKRVFLECTLVLGQCVGGAGAVVGLQSAWSNSYSAYCHGSVDDVGGKPGYVVRSKRYAHTHVDGSHRTFFIRPPNRRPYCQLTRCNMHKFEYLPMF